MPRRTEWAMWANEQALWSATIIFSSGVLETVGFFKRWPYGVFAIVVGLVIMILEYPRGKREVGKTMERPFQKHLTNLVDCFGCCGRSYCLRFVLYLLVCVPCSRVLALLMGGVSLMIASVLYMVAAVNGEAWTPCDAKEGEPKRRRTLHPPTRAPPRLNRPPDIAVIDTDAV